MLNVASFTYQFKTLDLTLGCWKMQSFTKVLRNEFHFWHLFQILYELEKKSCLVTRALSSKSCTRDTDSLHSCIRLRLVQEMACLYHSCKIWTRKHSYPNLIPIILSLFISTYHSYSLVDVFYSFSPLLCHYAANIVCVCSACFSYFFKCGYWFDKAPTYGSWLISLVKVYFISSLEMDRDKRRCYVKSSKPSPNELVGHYRTYMAHFSASICSYFE